MKKYIEAACKLCGHKQAVVSGAYLRRLRAEAGLTLREMARRLRFSAPYLSDIEHDRRNRLPAIVDAYERLAENREVTR